MPYHNLNVYKKAYEMALQIHKLTLTFPKLEQYELASQLRRSSKSIPVNIAEGMGKQESKADVRRFMMIALGSCDETRVWLEFAKDLNYLPNNSYEVFSNSYKEIGKMVR